MPETEFSVRSKYSPEESVKNPYMEDFSHELVRVTQLFVPTAQSLQVERKAWLVVS